MAEQVIDIRERIEKMRIKFEDDHKSDIHDEPNLEKNVSYEEKKRTYLKTFKTIKGKDSPHSKGAITEAKNILDEFCPQMDRLVKEAQSGNREYYIYQVPIAGDGNTSGGGGGGGFKRRVEFDYKEFKQNEKIRNLKNRYELDRINEGKY